MRAVIVREENPWPSGVSCLLCRRVAKPGEIAIVHTFQTHYGGKATKGGAKFGGYLLFHKPCLQEMLDQAPLDTYENLQAKIQDGEALFT